MSRWSPSLRNTAGLTPPDKMTGADINRFVAFYLPQFHAIPENDEWWGEGFTEWTKVKPCLPRFPGHYQPHVPADLGYYDLRDPSVREAQAALARQYRIDAFCYYHYWFEGRRLLNGPIDAVIATGEPNFPFCLCWANESWTRTWQSEGGSLLMPQTYSPEDDERHGRWLAEIFADPRYLRFRGRPIFLVYRASFLPDARRTTDLWRTLVTSAGLPEPYLCRVESSRREQRDPASLGFDAAVEFQPEWRRLGAWPRRSVLSLRRIAQRLGLPTPSEAGCYRYDYEKVVSRMLAKDDVPYPRFPGVAPSWDNSARRERGAVVLDGATPAGYRRWLEGVVRRERARGRSDSLVFVNAWNEWAEGCHLEPDQRWGRAFLAAHAAGAESALSMPTS